MKGRIVRSKFARRNEIRSSSARLGDAKNIQRDLANRHKSHEEIQYSNLEDFINSRLSGHCSDFVARRNHYMPSSRFGCGSQLHD